MPVKLPLGDDDRAFLIEMRAIQMNQAGEEVFVGLGTQESAEYLYLLSMDHQSDAERQREQELFEKHEPIRLAIIAAESEAEKVQRKH